MTCFVTHLESAIDGTRFAPGQVHTVHQGRPLWVRYDLAAVGKSVTPNDIARRPPSLWRYRELLPLPLDVEPVTLGGTPSHGAYFKLLPKTRYVVIVKAQPAGAQPLEARFDHSH